LFVDDGTDAVIRSIGLIDSRVNVLHRVANRGGLAGAVVEGLREVHGEYVCVLDADPQHPPERLPYLKIAAPLSEAGPGWIDFVRQLSVAPLADGPAGLRRLLARQLDDLANLFVRELRQSVH
jgi:glycosyltransferase involved in cell wall biosynthesis